MNFLNLKSSELKSIKKTTEHNDNLINDIFNTTDITDNFNEKHVFRDRLYTPIKTLFVFTKQCLSKGSTSCQQAVSELSAEEISKGNTISSNTGAYVKARERLDKSAMKDVIKKIDETANDLSNHTPILGTMDVKIIDGTTITMSDTKDNQETYPQHANQKEGSGFPLARLSVLMSLNTGTILDFDLAAHKGKGTGEHALFRNISHHITENTLLLGDAYYPSYFLICDLLTKSAHGIFKASKARNNDVKVIEVFDKKDRLVQWIKPLYKPSWMSLEIYSNLPQHITLRLIKINGEEYVTTLVDKKLHKNEIAKVYKSRWHIELNLRSIKTFMGMEHLTCKKPDTVEKEIAAHFIAYNIIRLVMVKSAMEYSCRANDLSFMNAMGEILASWVYLILDDNTDNFIESMLSKISSCKVGNRPGRSEPRAVKKRPKPFPRLQGNRHDYAA